MSGQLQRLVETAARKHGATEAQASLIGADSVRFICECFGGKRPYIPEFQHLQVARDKAIADELRAGVSARRIAQKFDVRLERVMRIASALIRENAEAARGARA